MRGPMVQFIRRRSRFEAQVYLNRVSIVRSDLRPIRAHGESRFCTAVDDCLDSSSAKVPVLSSRSLDEHIYIHPSAGFKVQVECGRIVTQDVAQEFADSSQGVTHAQTVTERM